MQREINGSTVSGEDHHQTLRDVNPSEPRYPARFFYTFQKAQTGIRQSVSHGMRPILITVQSQVTSQEFPNFVAVVTGGLKYGTPVIRQTVFHGRSEDSTDELELELELLRLQYKFPR